MVKGGKEDPRRSDEKFIVHYEPPAQEANYYQLLSMLLSMVTVFIKSKYFAWASIFCAVIGWANGRSSSPNQFSALIMSVGLLTMMYMQGQI
eukprot:m.211678 g.211678  ORF g.211678 m.211678 type:complete len:92 (+) comp18709_c0_seq1:43-318(+)